MLLVEGEGVSREDAKVHGPEKEKKGKDGCRATLLVFRAWSHCLARQLQPQSMVWIYRQKGHQTGRAKFKTRETRAAMGEKSGSKSDNLYNSHNTHAPHQLLAFNRPPLHPPRPLPSRTQILLRFLLQPVYKVSVPNYQNQIYTSLSSHRFLPPHHALKHKQKTKENDW